MPICCNKTKVANHDLFVQHWLFQVHKSTEFDNVSVVKGIILHSWVRAAADGIKHNNLQTVFQITSSWNWIIIQFGRDLTFLISVADPDLNPDPDTSDPYFFGPPGSGSFYH
jgi:hypothetical protein